MDDMLPTILPGGGRSTPVSLALPEGLAFDAWAELGERLAAVERSAAWWLGDWWAYGEHRYGDRKALVERLAAGDREFPSFQACMVAGSVSRAFGETLRRRKALSFAHHREVMALPPADQDGLLDAAAAEGWSSRELRAEVARRRSARLVGAPGPAEGCAVDDLRDAVARGLRFGTVYADPPWPYDNQATRGATGGHYRAMTLADLRALPVRELAADDAFLHLWTTNAFLFECPALLDAWGFTLKSTFVWAKPSFGTGNYWRNAHELLLTGARGAAASFADHGLRSWAELERGEHSGKPPEVRRMIERAGPGPYLELFGRGRVEGWAVWGDQADAARFLADARRVA